MSIPLIIAIVIKIWTNNCTVVQRMKPDNKLARHITFQITHQVNSPPPVLNCSDSNYFRIKSAVPVGFLCWIVHVTAKTQP